MSPKAQAQTQDWQPGELLAGKYRILERIGAGGMGAVHAARRLGLDDVVAIKSILPERSNANNRARFLREARAVARIHHPNVVQVFDLGESESGRPFMVMEYVDGPTLSRVLAGGRVPIERALELFADICKAVEAGHRRGVVHRDLKPGNVMIHRGGDGSETVKVLDFGLARVAEDEEIAHSRAGALVGTCTYMSPEAIEHGAVSPASDLFALGVMLYEIATGELPFRGANAIATIMKICEGNYRPARELVDDLPESVSAAVDAALRRAPSERPGSALELAALALGRASVSPTSVVSKAATLGKPRDEEDSQATVRIELPSEIDGSKVGESSVESWDSRSSDSDGPLWTGARDELAEGNPDEDTVVWDSEDEQRDSQRVRAALASPPFIGRKLELDALLEQLTVATVRGDAPVAVVLGDPGLGRSRLLRRFAELAREQHTAVFEGHFWGDEGDPAPAGETFLKMLAGARGVAENAGLDALEQELRAGADHRSGFAELARSLEAAAAGKTMVLVLDDLHCAPSRDLEFLTYLIRWGQRAAPVVIVASARSSAARSDAGTELSRWLLQRARRGGRTVLTLAPFDEDEIRAWLDATFGRLRIRPRELRRLAKASGGNPYFLSELVRHLVSSERIHRGISEQGGEGWVCERLGRDVLPEGLTSTIADQLAVLEAPLRALLEVAAVIGTRLSFEVLARAMGRDEDELDELVDQAVARGLLVEEELEGGADLRFRSATIQQVLYDRLGRRKARRIHKAVVEALVGLGHGDRQARVLAGHYRAIGDWPRTLAWALHGARAALGRHDHDAAELALEHAELALDKLGADAHLGLGDFERVRLASLAGTLAARVGHFAEGVSRLREARRLLDHRGEAITAATITPDAIADSRPLPYLRFEIALALARCLLGLGRIEEAATVGREALELAAGLAEHEAIAEQARVEAEWEARVALAHTLGRSGSWAEAIEVLSPVVDTAPLPSLRVLHVLGLRERGWLAARSGAMADADRYAGLARAEAQSSREPVADYCAASIGAVVHSSRGELREAVACYRDALRRARALSLRRREMIEQANLALGLVDLGELDEALQHMLSVRAIAREIGDTASSADSNVGLGRILRGRGDLDEAVESFRRGFEACESVGRKEYAAIALQQLGELELERGNIDAAREALTQACERFAEFSSLHQWEAELALARALRGAGEDEQAQAHADKARAVLEARRAEATDAAIRDAADRGLARVDAFLAG